MLLLELKGLLKKFPLMMSRSTERAVEKVIKYGAAVTEVSYPTSTWNEQGIDTS